MVQVITAEEMDKMTPDQRAAVVNERSHTNLDDLPDDFRTTVVATAKHLAARSVGENADRAGAETPTDG